MDTDHITYEIRGAIFEVNKELGGGFLEKVYENALLLELKKRGLTAESQVALDVRYKGDVVGEYIADIIVEKAVIIEIKAVTQLSSLHEAQLLNYLKATGLTIGFLVNFHGKKADIKRFAFEREC